MWEWGKSCVGSVTVAEFAKEVASRRSASFAALWHWGTRNLGLGINSDPTERDLGSDSLHLEGGGFDPVSKS